jgi:hypothetical protein
VSLEREFESLYVRDSQEVRIYSCEGPKAIKVLRLLSVTTNVGYDIILFLFSYSLKTLTFCDLGEANDSINSMGSLSVLWSPSLSP